MSLSTRHTHSDFRMRQKYPDLGDFWAWEGWPPGAGLHHRLQIGEVVWALKKIGTVEDRANASRVLRLRVEALGGESSQLLTDQNWSNLFGEMAGLESHGRSYTWDPPLIVRVLNGRRTLRIELNPARDDYYPPDPYPVLKRHRAEAEAVAAIRGAHAGEDAGDGVVVVVPDRPTGPALAIPEPGEGAARLRAILTPRPVASPPTPEPVAAVSMSTSEPIVEAGELDAWLSEPAPAPAPAPVTGLVDSLTSVGDRSLVDNALMLMALAGDMLTQAMVASATSAAAPEQSEDDALVKERLSAALEEGARLRKAAAALKTQQQMAESLARRTEAALAAERERANILEGNLQRVLRGEKVENTAALREVQKFMAEKPRVGVGA